MDLIPGEWDDLVYLDNAATSWPKPRQVLEAMRFFQERVGANPGRSGHRLSVEAGRIVYEARESVAALFNVEDPLRIVFTSNATEALNLAMQGCLSPGEHVVTSNLEHNSVMRPLRHLQEKGVEVSVVPCDGCGSVRPDGFFQAMRKNTKMIVLSNGSNVTGYIPPVRQIGEAARENGALFLVDAAQAAGCFPIDIEKDCIDLLAFTGHKSLLGPQGTGGLVVGDRVDLEAFKPLKRGGTGSRSEMDIQPEFLPDLCESGTPNTIGLAGLRAGVDYVRSLGLEEVRRHEMGLFSMLWEGLESVPGVTMYGRSEPEKGLATLSFNIEGMMPSEIGSALDDDYGVMCRVGLHCAPNAHRAIGSFPQGTVRFSLSCFTERRDILRALEAVNEIADGYSQRRQA